MVTRGYIFFINNLEDYQNIVIFNYKKVQYNSEWVKKKKINRSS